MAETRRVTGYSFLRFLGIEVGRGRTRWHLEDYLLGQGYSLSLSLSRVTASPFTLIFARLRALGKISRIGWKRWLSSSYRGFVPLISSLNRIASYTIYRIFINLIALGESGHLFQGNFFFWRGEMQELFSKEREFFCFVVYPRFLILRAYETNLG